MKKTILVLILGIILLAVFGPEAKAQVPKEGSISATTVSSGTYKALPMGNERVQMTYELTGVIIPDNDPSGPWTIHCLGALHAIKGEYNDDSGFCVETHSDGDQVFETYKGAGKLGGNEKATVTFVGGTGKFTGIQGGIETTEFSLRPAAEGTFQIYAKTKGQYKLP